MRSASGLRPLFVAALGVALIACGGPSSRTTQRLHRDPAQGTEGVAAVSTEPRGMSATGDERASAPPASATDPAVPPSTAQVTPPAVPEEEDEEVSPPSSIGARHVLVQWMGSERAGKSVLRSREQALAIAQEVHRRAKAGDDLGRLAVEYSDEPGAGPRGGSLGRFGKGQMVGAFEAAAFKLKVGAISDIVETPFGFHVIQRTQ